MQLILNNHFNTLEQFINEVQHWDLDFRLMGVGGFSGRVKQFVSRDVLLGYARFNRGLDQVGSTPPGYRTFVIVGEHCQGFRWRGHQVTQNDLLIFPQSNELHSASLADFEVFTISVQLTYFDQLINSLVLKKLPNRREVMRLKVHIAQELRYLASAIIKSTGGPMVQPVVRNLAEKLVLCVTETDTPSLPSLRKRDKAVDVIVDFVRNSPMPTSELAQLCQIAEVSERTLQYAFKERYGIAPNVFIKYWNLNTARRQLLSSNSAKTSINEIALKHGFLHQSQFASDYKKLFAELPFKTLSR